MMNQPSAHRPVGPLAFQRDQTDDAILVYEINLASGPHIEDIADVLGDRDLTFARNTHSNTLLVLLT
jgi:hypothetical protein